MRRIYDMKYYKASFYYVYYKVLIKLVRETYRHFKWQVWLLSILLIVFYFINQLAHLFFRLMDELFYRGYKRVKVTGPVFIIANPRSGTTFLHRLISMDDEKFAYTRFAQTFHLTVSYVKLVHILHVIDKNTGNMLRRIMSRVDKRVWGGWDDVHPMGFDKAEEDELVFAQMLLSPGIFIPFPYFHLIDDNKFLDNAPPEVRKNAMDFYESCIQRFMYATDGHKTYLAKNVLSTGRIKTLLERFPDAKIIYIARHPYQAVPSFASMCSSMYDYYLPKMPDDAPPKKAWAQLSIDFYKYAQQMKQLVPDRQFVQLKYDDLVKNPEAEVLKIYEHFGWRPSVKLLEALKKEQLRNGNYHSNHEYTLEQYGFSKQDINRELGDAMDEWGFEKEERLKVEG